jgi:hypothetical protein
MHLVQVAMTPLGPTLVFPASVREAVLDQHRELRGLLRGVLDECASPAQDDDRERFVRMIRDLRRRFDAHLEFEERELAPVLAIVDHWGPERLRAMHEEHARQRADLAGLLAGLFDGTAAGWQAEHLRRIVRSLVTELIRDMDDEESGCLDAKLLGAQVLEIERR